eukprot:TRINITY_DN49379_c0_g1_i1.p1 TRINITY_DN49379_c0_g1~~TRINITY_DN49379_c0_g1_i1.p1  ORF type:complete len:191 (-),score=43.39 TRINITY_DN49379_c0_g1_i1:150-722(-)
MGTTAVCCSKAEEEADDKLDDQTMLLSAMLPIVASEEPLNGQHVTPKLPGALAVSQGFVRSESTSSTAATTTAGSCCGCAACVAEGPSYTVLLEKHGGDSGLGLNVDYKAVCSGLLIVSIQGGLATAWNDACTAASERLEVGDVISAVNEAQGEARALLKVCKHDTALRLTVKRKRASPPSQEACEGSSV